MRASYLLLRAFPRAFTFPYNINPRSVEIRWQAASWVSGCPDGGNMCLKTFILIREMFILLQFNSIKAVLIICLTLALVCSPNGVFIFSDRLTYTAAGIWNLLTGSVCHKVPRWQLHAHSSIFSIYSCFISREGKVWLAKSHLRPLQATTTITEKIKRSLHKQVCAYMVISH